MAEGDGIKSTGASGKYRTYLRGDTGPGAPSAPSGKYRSYTRGDTSPGAPKQTLPPPPPTAPPQRPNQPQAPPPPPSTRVVTDPRTGMSVLIREGAHRGQTAAEVFQELGAPKTEELGQITFGRQPKKSLYQKGKEFFTGEEKQGYTEPSRESRITRTTYNVPNAASAQFAGFPTKDEAGKPIEFPTKFVVTKEYRKDYPEKSFVEVNTPEPVKELLQYGEEKFNAANRKGIELADQARRTPPGTTFTEGTPGQRLQRAVEDMAGRVVMRIQDTGSTLQKGGAGLADFGERLESRNSKPTESEIEANKLKPTLQQISGGFGFIKRELLFRGAKGAEGIGGFVEGEGQLLQERPVTGGLSGATIVLGGGFGALSEGATALREAGYVVREGEKVAKAGRAAQAARVLGTGAKAVEYGTGAGLGGLFVVQTIEEVRTAETTREAGRRLAGPVNELAGFGLGAKLGGAAAGAGIKAGARTAAEIRREIAIQQYNYKNRGQLITEPMARELAKVSRDLSLEIEVEPVLANVRAKEAMERAGLKVTEQGRGAIIGEPQRITSEQLNALNDEFLVRSVRAERSITLQENQGPTNAVEAKGLPQVGSTVGETKAGSASQRIATAGEILGNDFKRLKLQDLKAEGLPQDFFTIQRGEKSNLPLGLRKLTQEINIETFQPFEESGIRDLVRTGGRPNSEAAVKRLGFEPKKLTGPQNLGQLERVERFSNEPGPTQVLLQTEKGTLLQRGRAQLALNQEAGKFKLLEFTEDRRFARGTGKIPGRPVITEGTFTPEKQPLIFQKLKRPSKPKSSGTKGITGGENEVSGGNGQVLIQKTETKTKTETKVKTAPLLQEKAKATTKQELKLETKQEAKQEQKQEQFSEQLRKSKTLTERLGQNRFSKIKEAQDNARKLRAATALRPKQATTTTLASLQGQRPREREKEKEKATPKIETTPKLRTGTATIQTQTPELPVPEPPTARTITGLEVPGKTLPKRFGAAFGSGKKLEEGYNVLIKRQGRFEKLTNVALTRSEALAAGARATDIGASQTFKLVKSDQAVSDRGSGKLSENQVLKKFKKLAADTFRERKKSAIDTPGELQEITFKGIAASKAKRLRV